MSQRRGRPFEPGNRFGRGRPKGSRNKISKIMDGLLEKHGESIMRKCIIRAMEGDRAALRLCIERLSPLRRGGFLNIPFTGAGTLPAIDASSETLLRAVMRGKLTPTEGETITNILESRRKVIEMKELQARIEQLAARISEDRAERS